MVSGFFYSEKERKRPVTSHHVFFNLILKVIYHHFYHILLVTQTNPNKMCKVAMERTRRQMGTMLEATTLNTATGHFFLYVSTEQHNPNQNPKSLF